jgi:hypothetical protein
MITWSEVKAEFDWDGSLRDIYIHATTINDWRAVYTILKQSPRTELWLNGELAPLPDDCADFFAAGSELSAILRARLGTITAVFHFFTEEEIECDIDPRDVKSQVELDALLAFLKEIGDSVGKQSILTPENFRESVIFRYDPNSQMLRYEKENRG